MAGYLYLCQPIDRYLPGVGTWVDDAVSSIEGTPEWQGWVIRKIEYDTNASLRVSDLVSQVIGKTGPILLLDPVQSKVVEMLHEKLGSRTTLLNARVRSMEEVIALLNRAREIHESGEPHLCRSFVVALLLMRKLDQERKWAGHNDKGYMWAADIPKGRGIAEHLGDAIPSVLSHLLQHGLVIQKKSRTSHKYALNPDRREEIYHTLRERHFSSAQLTQIFHRDQAVISVRELDLLDCYWNRPERK